MKSPYRSLIPDANPLYQTYGEFDVVSRVIESRQFCPMYIAGPTGIGKTEMVLEACARAGRPLVRFNPSYETDREVLFGGFRLKQGETLFEYGPVITAMLQGCTLLLDEVDLLSPEKGLCLQPILEGRPYRIPETNELISPKPGFNIIATANTKGRGSDSGLYIGAQIHNEAFLERFVLTITHGYPSFQIETAILTRLAESLGVEIERERIEHLVRWATQTRQLFEEQGDGAVITPRRLCHILKIHAILGSLEQAINLAIQRFEPAEIASLTSLLAKLSVAPTKNTGECTWDYDPVVDTVFITTGSSRHLLHPIV